MKVILFVSAMLFLSACTRTIDIPAEDIVLVFDMGKLQSSVSGPTKLEKSVFYGHKVISKKQKIELNNGEFSIEYEILDPVQFYILGENRTMLKMIESELERKVIENNKVSSIFEIYEIVEGLKLPIKIVKIPNPAFKRDALKRAP